MATRKAPKLPTMEQTIDDIARNVLRLETLATRNSDYLDFKEVAVWQVKEALEAAYRAGEQAGRASILH